MPCSGETVMVLAATLALATQVCADAGWPWPHEEWETTTPEQMGLDRALVEQARDYALTGGGSGCIVRGGRLVMAWGDQDQRYDLKSTTKSIGVTALGLAIADELMGPDDPVLDHHPTFGDQPAGTRAEWVEAVTLRHLATHTAGFEKPGGYSPLVAEPGTQWAYSDCGPNWLAEAVTLAYGRDLQELMFERVFGPLGVTRDALRWRENAYRPHEIDGVPRREFGSGIHASVQAMARIGYLYLRDGRWRDEQIIPATFVDLARTVDPALPGLPVGDRERYGDASSHYGLLWWTNADGTLAGVPRDAFWSWGLHDSLIVVIPSLDLVVARAGSDWARDWSGHYEVLAPFLAPIVAAAKTAAPHPSAPYPPSEAALGMAWAPQQRIVRAGEGSDNWPITWGDDDALYTAYGDGWGFQPRVPEKLSLGLARVTGPPDAPQGENTRSDTAEQRGDGSSGRKASGMLMVGGRLYMLVRNADNAQLAWSDDHGATWMWADWRFETGFGCPTFLNFGPDYAGARDEFVYVHSPDAETAYDPADRMVLARVQRDRLPQRAAWEFFAGLEDGEPRFSADIADRAAVFEHPGRCYRSGITHCAPLGRYLWWQVLPGDDVRFEGGFGVYETTAPWGPWRTVYFTERWDVGPGESGRFPTKWMSEDRRTVHLVFSGDDSFAVRRADLWLAGDAVEE